MWKLTEIILVIFLILCLISAVNLYMVNKQLPDGCMAVFSFDKYIDRLVSIDFPEYDLYTFIASVNNLENNSVMSFDEVRSVIAPFMDTKGAYNNFIIVSTIQRYHYNALYELAQHAIDGDFSGSITYDGCTYSPVSGNYNLYDEVLFTVTIDVNSSSAILNRIVYTVRYVFQCIGMVFKVSKNLLPFNCYDFVYYNV